MPSILKRHDMIIKMFTMFIKKLLIFFNFYTGHSVIISELINMYNLINISYCI